MQVGGYFPAQPFVKYATNTVEVITNYYTWATFINQGGANGDIDFGSGNIVTLRPGESISMPYLGRPYGMTTIDGTGTSIQIVYVR